MTYEPTAAEFELLSHRLAHLLAVQGKPPWLSPEVLAVDGCWDVLDPAPDWVLTAVRAGRPAREWCPRLNPDLYAANGPGE